MTTREALIYIRDLGYPISRIAKVVDKSPSTIQKWANGSNKYLASEIEEEVRQEIIRLKEEWMKIDV